MKKLLPLVTLLLLSTSIWAQNTDEDEVFKVVEVQPEFPGGQDSLLHWLAMMPYPAEAKANKVEGAVYCRFVVEKDGSVSHIEIARSSGSDLLDQTVVDYLKTSPLWKPGLQRGKPVRVQYVLPVRFRL